MGLKAAVQALKKAEELKARVSRHNDLLNNSEVWSDQQQLQTVYHQVLVLDLEYALDKKVEQELWTLGFKNHIAALQHLSRDKKNPRRSECQALLSWCLEAASGFYLTLLQELCSAFELDLPFRRRGAVYGQTKHWPNSEQLTQPHKSSCLYICQYCLVHLGDIARYRSQRKQAETFYQHAILLSPSSGQPYNQLALLEASRGDKLATVFHYVRSISVKHPFPAAATNLSNTLLAVVDNDEPLTELHSKLSLNDFITIFLRVHGLLHLAIDLEQAELCVKTLNATFTALVATKAFSALKLIQMTAINLYALRHTLESFSNEQLSADELRVKNLVLELLAGAFSAYLLPIYTMGNDSTLLEYYALPAIKLTLDWLKTDPKVLNEPIFTKRLQLWPSLSKLLNSIQSNIGDFETKNHEKIPLPEDRDLQCFLPLVNAFKELDFTSENLNKDVTFFNKLRISRLVNLGVWLSNQTVDNNVLISAKKLKNPSRVTFEPSNQQPDPTTELLEELKHFNIKDETPKEIKKPPIKAVERRGGILKPQGSLEKAREEREQALMFENGETSITIINPKTIVTPRNETSKIIKRTRQNVALQALAKKVEETNKQVTFQTEPIQKPKDKLIIKSELPKLMNPNLNSDILSIPLVQNAHQSIPMPPNQSDPTKYTQNMSLGFNNQNQFPRPSMNVSNIPFSVPFNYHNNIPPNYSRPQQFPAPPTMQNTNQNSSFNLPNFEVPPPNTLNNFPPTNDQFNSWMRDDKLPMPPSNWWTNNQKPIPRTYPTQIDPFNPNYSYNVNPPMPSSNLGSYMPDGGVKPGNLEFNRPYNAGVGNTGSYNNTSMWNSGPNCQNNLQMLLNQNGPQMMQNQTTQQQNFGELSQMTTIPRDNPMTSRDTNDNQNNSMPGYSLFNSNWAPNLTVHAALKNSPPDRPAPLLRQQSLFSGPGPSPLERLLEQQKQLRGAKEDT